jgi:hypothetical protein
VAAEDDKAIVVDKPHIQVYAMVLTRGLVMSNTNFTQGDWQVRVDQIVPSSKAESFVFATDEFDVISPMLGIRNESDANLIAAAPKMYAALSQLLTDNHVHGHTTPETLNNIEKLLAEARGE